MSTDDRKDNVNGVLSVVLEPHVVKINGAIKGNNSVRGAIGASGLIVNDYLISLVEGDKNYTLSVTKGSQIQSVTVDDAISIESVTQIESSQESGGKNTIRILLSNGEYTDFDFYNGEKGDKGDPGLTIEQANSILNAEQQRVLAENQRNSAETVRENNEDERILYETLRRNNEAERVQKEKNRVSAENTRINNESARQGAEAVREYNEDQREIAEDNRVTEWNSLKKEFNNTKSQVMNLAVDVEELSDQVDSAARDVIEAYDKVNRQIQTSEGLIEEVEEVSEDLRNMTAQAETLPAGSSATASYVDGVLTIGVPRGADGESISFHICSASEYDVSTGIPTIQNPDTQTFYLVPSGEGSNLFIEWAYVNNAWERFGSADVDLSNYVQKTDYATASEAGVVKIMSNSGGGIDIVNNQYLRIAGATDAHVKSGSSAYRPLSPSIQHLSTFYGLAKAAGDSTQSASENAVGTYTDEAKAAIQQMLDVPSNSDMSAYATKTDTILDTTLSMGRKAETTIGLKSVAMGQNIEASGMFSHGEGFSTIASAIASHAEGSASKAMGPNSHAEGVQTEAIHVATHAEGGYTKAAGGYSWVSGKYNVPDNLNDVEDWVSGTQYEVGDKVKLYSITSGVNLLNIFICKEANDDVEFNYSKWQVVYEYNYINIVGNGTADNARSNAYALTWTGDGKYAGDVYVHANTDSSGGVKLATVEDIPDAPVQDVQVNGVSVLSNGVANVPTTAPNILGVMKPGYGLSVSSSGEISVLYAGNDAIKAGTERFIYIDARRAYAAAFYGLAKAAGDTTQSQSANAVGNYTDNAKEAIQSMLGISQMLAPTNSNLVASQAYAIGDVFAANGKLYKATAAIAQDGAIIPDTNCVETTMAEAGGKIKDVQVNSVSVVGSDGVADVPIANAQRYGVIKASTEVGSWGVYIDNGMLKISKAKGSEIKTPSSTNNAPIVPWTQHLAVFYGLSKVAGVDLANETVTLGTYPETSKTAIRAMIGATSNNVIAVQDTQPTDPDTKIWLPETAPSPVQVPTVAEMNTALAGKVDDVQVNGTSVVSNGVANIPIAGSGTATLGVVYFIPGTYGVGANANGRAFIQKAQIAEIKDGVKDFLPIVPLTQHASTFYGLAKASGDATQSASSNAVGVYTDSAKASIKSMLGIVDGSTGTVDVSGTTPTITAVENTRYVCGEVATLSFTPPASGISIVRFTSGTTATVLTLPSTVKFPEWFDSTTLETETIYEICITDGIYGAVMSWAL